MQFGINKHKYIFSKTDKIAWARKACAIHGLWKNLQVLVYSKLYEKNTWKNTRKFNYHNYAGAKRAHLVW